jgi:hypothetical protein
LTVRAVVIGLLAVAFVCSYTYFNDHIMRQTMFVGNNMPISVYGLLVVFLAFIYPLLRRIHRKLPFSRSELAIILVLTLTACAIPGSNLLRLFTPTLMMPHRYVRTEPGWQKQDIMDLVPDHMLADVGHDEDTVLNGFTRGLRKGNERISPAQVPWSAWWPSLMFWMPILLSMWIAFIGLALVVHRQWADHEHLPYPIVTFTESLLPGREGAPSLVFRNRIFWMGLLFVLLFHMYNYVYLWFPHILPGKLPLGVDFSPLAELFPTFEKGGGEHFLSGFHLLYFTVIAVAYFLPTDVSLSLGIGPFLWVWVAGLLTTYGIGTTGWQGGWPFGIQRDTMCILGAYFAMLLVVLYTGRHYYTTVFRRAMGIPSREKTEASAVWGARIFLISMVLFVVYADIIAHLDWPIALLLAIGLTAIYLVMGRLIAETGLFFIVVTGTPATLIWAFMGARALGPEIMLVMFMFCMILFYDSREALMPFVVNGLKLADDCKLKVGRTAGMAILAIIVGLAVGIPVTLYFQYDEGIDVSAWQNQQPKNPFNEVIGAMQRLEAQGQLDEAGQASGLSRFAQISMHKPALITFSIAAMAVLVFSAMRLRFAKWPLHPVMFLVWSTYAGNCFAQSFLIGWLIKVAVMKYGGANIYQRLKPLMFGLIAGEMMGGMIPMVVSLVYYLATGDQPKSFWVMPR